MNYELAKKLKDAGFQQKINENMLYGWETSINGEQIPVEAYAPTLSELIEACNPLQEDFALFSNGSEWRAEYKNPNTMVRLGEVEGEYQGEGSTPEEAVANLWLMLNQK